MNASDIDVAIVPVAGLGTRLLPATKSQPKEMLPVGRRPVVQYVVEELTRMGIRQILFITGPGKDSIENHFDTDHALIQMLRERGKEDLLAELEFEGAATQYFYTRQRRQLGLGHAVLQGRHFVGNRPFVVALGDSIIGLNAQSDIIHRMKDVFVETGADGVIAFEEVSQKDVDKYGIAAPAYEGDVFPLRDVIEKPRPEGAPSNLAIAARYVFSPVIFETLERTDFGAGDEIQLTDAVRLLLQEGGSVYGVRLRPGEKRYDIGNFPSYFRAFVEFALADEKYGQGLRSFLEELIHAHHP